MRSLTILLLPLCSFSWWCETSKNTGCRGQSRHFVREASVANPFLAFGDIKTSKTDDPIVVDWDGDGHLDVILRADIDMTDFGIRLFSFKPGNHFVEMVPNPFKGLPLDLQQRYSRPAFVDWNDDGKLDMIIGAKDGIHYYERVEKGFDQELRERTGADNPFKHIRPSFDADLSVADWDGDGDLDLLVSSLYKPMLYFERQSDGSLVLVDDDKNPFRHILPNTTFRRPLMADWNSDGRMDLLLLPKVGHRNAGNQDFFDDEFCRVELYQQADSGDLLQTFDPLLRNEGCRNFTGSGMSLADLDGDGDLDVVFGANKGPLHVFERTPSGWRSPNNVGANSTPVDMIQLESEYDGNWLLPFLADWDLDGDLDLALIHANPSEHHKNQYFEQQSDGTVKEVGRDSLTMASCPIDWALPLSFVDFDGNGKKDLVGFRNPLVPVICLQTSSGFELVPPERDPFFQGSRNKSCFLSENSSLCPWDNDWPFGLFFAQQLASFVDWDGDGDLDMLRVNSESKVYLYEQLPDFEFLPQPLPLPTARGYMATDFDGDGDIDIMISQPDSNSFLHFERRSDGTLQQLFGTDNPFDAVDVGRTTWSHTFGIGAGATLGDWNGDGEVDLIVVDEYKVSLWINRPLETFVEIAKSKNPFGQFRFTMPTSVSLVNAREDGRKFDLVVPHLFDSVQGPLHRRNGSYRYFRRQLDGELVEQHGEDNPFDALDLENFGLLYPDGSDADPTFKSLVVDLDGDGDLDIIGPKLAYRRNDQGHFKDLLPSDPTNPFHGIEDTAWSVGTLVDWDHDGDLDYVQAFYPSVSSEVLKWMHGVIHEMKQNGTTQAEMKQFLQLFLNPRMRFYRQDRNGSTNVTFSELTGPANPFHHIQNIGLDKACPAVVDLDRDGQWELVLSSSLPGAKSLRYYKQTDGVFKQALDDPFDSVSLRSSFVQVCPLPIFADWDGDDSIDLVVTGTDKVRYFQRGVCMPSTPYCEQGTCNEQTSTCDCFPGAEGEDCTLCGEFHVRDEGTCRKCPGYASVAGTCTRRGVCEDDADARRKRAAWNGSRATPATGAGNCTCSEPFYGEKCELGECPPGQRLDRDALVENRSDKYPKWEACVPCQSGRFKNVSGIQDCDICPGGHIPVDGIRCVPCEAGKIPSADHNKEICVPCEIGYVSVSGSATCTPCEAGFAPNAENSSCIPCKSGSYARPRSAQCSDCPVGSIPGFEKSGCEECTGQTYAQLGDDVCQVCTFPSMILGDDNWCTTLYTALFTLAFFVLVFFVLAVFGRLRLHCLRRRVKKFIAAKNWEELQSMEASLLEFGLWKRQACKELSARKQEVKSQSFQLGISLQYVFERLETVYKETAEKAEWHLDEWGPVTKSGYLVKVRNCGIQLLDPVAAWNALPTCDYPKNPNFHQVAGLLAYGPWALGKHLCCPRDGKPDCSVVDALQAESNSAKATWFLSWVWGYSFSTVYKALARWWERHRVISGAGLEDGIYLWWCVFVNNQFRMLEAGIVEEPGDLFDVFGQQLEGIGKMLMCLDNVRNGLYTSRIWCIFEVFVACQRSIPTTVILPDLDVGAVTSLKDLTRECRVDAEQAKASVQADADAIKEHIKKKHQCFEYVNRTVEHALWCEVIEYMEGSDGSKISSRPSQESTSVRPSTLTESEASRRLSGLSASTTIVPSTLTESEDTERSSVPSARPQCNLQ